MPAYAKTMRRSTRRRVIPGSVTPNPRVVFGPVFGAAITLDSPPFNWDPGALVAVIIDATGGATGETLNSFSATNWTGSAWTIVGFTTVTASKVSVWIAYAVAGSTAQTTPSVGTATFAGASTDNQMIGVQFSGQDPTTPVDTSATVSAGDAITTTTPALTLGTAPLLVDWVLSAYASRNNQPLPGTTGFSILSKGFAHANPMVPALVQVRTGSTSTAVDAQGMGTAANAGVAIVIKAPSAGVSQNVSGRGDALGTASGAAASIVNAAASATARADGAAASNLTTPASGAAAATASAAGTASVATGTAGVATAIGTAGGTGTPNTVAAGIATATATAAGTTSDRVNASGAGTAIASGAAASIVTDAPTGSGAAIATAAGVGTIIPAGSASGSASASGTATGACTVQAVSAGSGTATGGSVGQSACRVSGAASASAGATAGGASFVRLNTAGAAVAFGAATALAALNVLASATADALAVATGVASTAGAIVIATPPSRTGVIPPSTGRGSTVSGGTRGLVVPASTKAGTVPGAARVLIISPTDRTVST